MRMGASALSLGQLPTHRTSPTRSNLREQGCLQPQSAHTTAATIPAGPSIKAWPLTLGWVISCLFLRITEP